MKLKILRKCRLYQHLSIDTKQDPSFFSLNSTFKCKSDNKKSLAEYVFYIIGWIFATYVSGREKGAVAPAKKAKTVLKICS